MIAILWHILLGACLIVAILFVCLIAVILIGAIVAIIAAWRDVKRET